MRLTVGIPSNGEMRVETTLCLISALFQTRLERLHLAAPCGCYIHENRTSIAKEALQNLSDRVLFIDTDMIFPENTIQHLYDLDKDIVGVAYNKRGKLPRESAVVYSGQSPPSGLRRGLFKCKALPAGVMMVKTDVFKKMKSPWFFYEDLGNNDFRGEDYWFCMKAKEAGFDIWCDNTLEIQHIGVYKY